MSWLGLCHSFCQKITEQHWVSHFPWLTDFNIPFSSSLPSMVICIETHFCKIKVTSNILEDLRTRVMCSLPNNAEFVMLRNAGVGGSENGRVRNSGVHYSPEILKGLAKTVRINLNGTQRGTVASPHPHPSFCFFSFTFHCFTFHGFMVWKYQMKKF